MELLDALQFEREWENRVAPKDAAIRARFGISAARYYQQLYTWLDQPETVQADPLLVRRLLRIRDTRTHQRASRTYAQTSAT